MYKTITNLFESVNDLHTRFNDKFLKKQQIKEETIEKNAI